MKKVKLVAVIAAILLVGFTSQVNAAIATPNSGNGELYLTAWQPGYGSYVRDLGIFMDDFGTANASASAGFTGFVDNFFRSFDLNSDGAWAGSRPISVYSLGDYGVGREWHKRRRSIPWFVYLVD